MMYRFEKTQAGAYAEYVVDNSTEAIVGIAFWRGMRDEELYLVGDRVKLTPDSHGYICCGIYGAKEGKIVDIQRTDDIDWFHIETPDGQDGYCKSSRITIVA